MDQCSENQIKHKLDNRRAHLAWWIKSMGILIAAPLINACKLFREKEKNVGTIQELRSKKYIIAEFNGDDIFVGLDENENIYALNLICTHKQCTVAFKADENQFICPCHKGRYTRYGKVISGKPKRDLHRYPITLDEDNIIVRDM